MKPIPLKNQDHDVLNPALPDEDFDAAVRIAQAELDQHHPDVVVGSSRGGAVAMNIDAGATPLVLLCPAWKRWGTATTVKPGTVILHSPADEVVPFADSLELLRNSGLDESALIVAGSDHRLADRVPLAVMLMAVEECGARSTACGRRRGPFDVPEDVRRDAERTGDVVCRKLLEMLVIDLRDKLGFDLASRLDLKQMEQVRDECNRRGVIPTAILATSLPTAVKVIGFMTETGRDTLQRPLPEGRFWAVSISAGGNSYAMLRIPDAPSD